MGDHNVAEWGIWIGRPLLGQWVWDIIRTLDLLDDLARAKAPAQSERSGVGRPYFLVGRGTMSLPALIAAGLDARVAGVWCQGGLVSFVGETSRRWSGVAMGLIAPGILDMADISQLAALVAPRPLLYTEAVNPEGDASTDERTRDAFTACRSVYDLVHAHDRLGLVRPADTWAFLLKR